MADAKVEAVVAHDADRGKVLRGNLAAVLDGVRR